MLIADNLHAQNPIVSDCLERLDPRPLRRAVRLLQQNGAEAFDLNPGYLSRRREDRMAFMVEAVQEVSTLPLLLDSPNPRVLAAGMRACRKPPILNGLTLEPEKIEQVLPLAAQNQSPLVLLLIGRQGLSPASLDEKAALALELLERALAAGIPGPNLIVDPILPNLSWPDAHSQIRAVAELVRLLATGDLLAEPVRTMVGLSNLRSGLRSRYGAEYDAGCLGALTSAGLDSLLADVSRPTAAEAWHFIRGIAAPFS